MMKFMMMMMGITKRGVPMVVDHWLNAIADMMSHTLIISIIMIFSMILMISMIIIMKG